MLLCLEDRPDFDFLEKCLDLLGESLAGEYVSGVLWVDCFDVAHARLRVLFFIRVDPCGFFL